MNKHFLLKSTLTAFLILTACNISINTQDPTATAPVAPTVTTAGFAWPDEAGECTLTTSSAVNVYSRPSNQADVFGEVKAGFETVVGARTAEGWAGFDPGVAQAANMGIFRLRWIFFEDAELSGGCLSIPEEAWLPDPVACYTMPMEPVDVYAEADNGSSVLTTLNVEDFAAVLGVSGTGWAQVDLGLGNTGLSGIGWVDENSLNMNGSACGELPTVTP